MSDTDQALDDRADAAVKGPRRRALKAAKAVRTANRQRRKAAKEAKRRRRADAEIIMAPIRGTPQLLRLWQVLALLGLGKTQFLAAVQAGEIAPPVKILSNGRANAWLSEEIFEQIDRRRKARDEKLGKAAGKSANGASDAEKRS
jgi:predicted DNA-binding transcriptional regulator AlpA